MSIHSDLCRFCGRLLYDKRSVERGYGRRCGLRYATVIHAENKIRDAEMLKAWNSGVWGRFQGFTFVESKTTTGPGK